MWPVDCIQKSCGPSDSGVAFSLASFNGTPEWRNSTPLLPSLVSCSCVSCPLCLCTSLSPSVRPRIPSSTFCISSGGCALETLSGRSSGMASCVPFSTSRSNFVLAAPGKSIESRPPASAVPARPLAFCASILEINVSGLFTSTKPLFGSG